MASKTLAVTASLVAIVSALGFVTTGRAPAAEPALSTMQVTSSDASALFVPLGVGKSIVIDLPRDIKDLLVADPKIANAVVRTSRRIFIVGVAVGQTNVYFFDAQGYQIGGLDIAVKRDLNGVRAALKRASLGGDVVIEGVGEGIVLSGDVRSPLEAQRAYDIASRLVGSGASVVNDITVHDRDQVMLKVTVAEVKRDIIKQLGIDLSGSFNAGSAVVNFNNINPLPISGPLSPSNITGTFRSVTATVRAMERAGVIRTLAEPTLTAISGESASFIAGGEFPVPVASTTSGGFAVPTIEFKKFGVSLNFTPVVLSAGRISLRVMTEVSELSPEGAISVGGTSVPSVSTRRVNTTVEIPSGGSLAMAGMIQEQTKQQLNGLPGLMQIPVLGTLFKSRDYLNRQSELMILVTPYIVRAVDQKALSRPTDGFADASDASTVLLGRFNKLYGVPARACSDHLYA